MLDKNIFKLMHDSCSCSDHDDHKHDHDDHECSCSCCCDHDHEENDSIVTMVDEETGEEFQFSIVDDFEYNGDIYCVLLTLEDEPEALIVKIVEDEDGEHFMSIEESEYDEVFAEYERILDSDEDDSEE